jgi:hypothetical protein
MRPPALNRDSSATSRTFSQRGHLGRLNLSVAGAANVDCIGIVSSPGHALGRSRTAPNARYDGAPSVAAARRRHESLVTDASFAEGANIIKMVLAF